MKPAIHDFYAEADRLRRAAATERRLGNRADADELDRLANETLAAAGLARPTSNTVPVLQPDTDPALRRALEALGDAITTRRERQ